MLFVGMCDLHTNEMLSLELYESLHTIEMISLGLREAQSNLDAL